jgi:tetrahydromethanopterin S-methyltransferase subunit A
MDTMVQSAVKTATEMQRQLTARAGEDADFRAQVIADPREAIRQEFGVVVPDHMTINVHENDGDVLNIALPPSGKAELSEEAMEAIAAGLCCCVP